jgi:hypothetical protein
MLQDVMLNFYFLLLKDDIASRSFPLPKDKSKTLIYDFYNQTARPFSHEPLSTRCVVIVLLIGLCWVVQRFYQDGLAVHVVLRLTPCTTSIAKPVVEREESQNLLRKQPSHSFVV